MRTLGGQRAKGGERTEREGEPRIRQASGHRHDDAPVATDIPKETVLE